MSDKYVSYLGTIEAVMVIGGLTNGEEPISDVEIVTLDGINVPNCR